jgi:hypothetical protein
MKYPPWRRMRCVHCINLPEDTTGRRSVDRATIFEGESPGSIPRHEQEVREKIRVPRTREQPGEIPADPTWNSVSTEVTVRDLHQGRASVLALERDEAARAIRVTAVLSRLTTAQGLECDLGQGVPHVRRCREHLRHAQPTKTRAMRGPVPHQKLPAHSSTQPTCRSHSACPEQLVGRTGY